MYIIIRTMLLTLLYAPRRAPLKATNLSVRATAEVKEFETWNVNICL
jgi:hypothetical protein